MDVYRERELKFDVLPNFELPDVGQVLVGSEVERRTVMLSSRITTPPGSTCSSGG